MSANGFQVMTRISSNHALPVTASKPTTRVTSLASSGMAARKVTFCQSNVPAGNSAAGQVFSWSVTIGAMNFTPLYGFGLRLTPWALIRAVNCTT